MSEKYFEKFPIISYANTLTRDVTSRVVVVSSIYNNPSLYYPYDIQQYERADNIADRYYSDQYKDWILKLTNKVIDPYYDWYIDQDTFNAFIIKKYGSLARAQEKIKHYQNNWYANSDNISSITYEALPSNAKRFWEPVLVNGQNVITPNEYTRIREDWALNTNKVIQYTSMR